MKRFMTACTLCFLGICLFFTTVSISEAKQSVYIMKIGHAMAADSTRHQALEKFKANIEKKAKGRLKVELYPAGTLGDEPSLIESLKMGALQGYVGGTFDAMTPKLNLFLVPFMFTDTKAFNRVVKNKVTVDIMKDAEKNAIKILAIADGGTRDISNNIRPIRTPADMVGLKMRVPSVEAYIKSIQALGANTVIIPYGETYMALRTGVADGQENPLMNMVTMKFHEVQKYLTIVNYIWAPEPFVVCLSWYNSLPKDLQKILTNEAWGYAEIQNKLRSDLNSTYLKTVKDAGVKVYVPTAKERELFINACKSVDEFFLAKKYFSRTELDAFRKVAKGL